MVKRRSFKVGDVVMLKNDEKRNEWPIGRIELANTDENGHCRKVKIRTIYGTFERPISNLILLEEVDSPPRKPAHYQDES